MITPSRVGLPVVAFMLAVSYGSVDKIAAQQPALPLGGVCTPAAFLTFEHGRLAGVDWVDYRPGQVHTRAVLTQSRVIDATIDLRPDQTAAHSSAILSLAGEPPDAPRTRDLGEGAVYWSPMIVSSVEQAVARARILNAPSSKIPGASLYSDVRSEILVERLASTDWVVRYQDRRYDVLTDDQGCLLAATLPDFGVTIERRAGFPAAAYPLWAPYAAPPDGAYRSVDVTTQASAGRVLSGTLTTPIRTGATPAVVLITGLSPHERNNGAPPWMPFRDIADALTRAGIAVLRVDDRGVGTSTGDRSSMTIFDKADDVRTEIAWLRSRPSIDPRRIALVGYSEGGLIAPMVTAKDPALAGVITLAGPGVPGQEVARYQVEQPILRGSAHLSEPERKTLVEKALADALRDLTPHESSFLAIDPLAFDRAVRCPVLVVQGGADADVPVRSAERIAAAMRGAGNQDVTVRIFPGLSHSLLPDPDGLSSGWAGLPGFLTAPELLDEVTRWAVSKLLPVHPAADRPKRGRSGAPQR